MKITTHPTPVCIRWSALLAMAVGAIATLPAQAQTTPDAGLVKIIEGEVTARPVGGGPARTLKPGDPIKSGEELVSGVGASMGFTLQDGTRVALSPSSSLRLDQFTYEPRSESGSLALALLKGSIRFVSGTMAKIRGDSVKIITNTALVGVRGTDFIVEAGE